MEVLFAILIVTVGLLAALAVFPVAASMAKKGEVADVSAISGRAAVHAFRSRGFADAAIDSAGTIHKTRWLDGAGGWITPAPGVAYCIDPRGMAANAGNPANDIFPYSASAGQPRMVRATLDRMALTSTQQVILSGVPMDRAMSDSVFTFGDDLTTNKPDDRSLPSFGAFSAGKRASGGHFSWMATLAQEPQLLTPGLELYYVLSVVVFHDRPSDMAAGDPLHERVVTADFSDAGGLGLAGGEVYLTWTAPQNPANDLFAKDVQLHVRQGDWLMLAGWVPQPIGEVAAFRWCKVTECDTLPEYHAAEGHYAIAASLAGGDWTVDGYATHYGLSGSPGTPPIAVLVEGVVAVYEKTIRVGQLRFTDQ